ncbi:MAG: pyridine nucleotide-disulfide oxidoreductase/dicluster-binding protein [Desulfobulbus sp.]|jgi:glutamate synthase (NADPH/NADH) small chain
MDQSQLRALEARCIQEEPPFCMAACPLHVDVRAFMACLRRGDLRGARKILDRTLPFPDLLGRICEAPCRAACKRSEAGDPLAVGRLEQYCVTHCAAVLKPPKIPGKGGKIAVIGAGLAGMTAALDLSRKGRPATLYAMAGEIGGSLRRLGPALPPALFDQAAELLRGYGATLCTDTVLESATLKTLIDEHDAVFIDRDEIDHLPFGGSPDPVSLALGPEGCFVSATDHRSARIDQAADGRRAALSIERFLQNVSLTAQRDKEGPHATRLVTRITGIEPAAEIVPADPEGGYNETEARAEADRCLGCECMECVAHCAYLQHYKEYPKTLVRKIYNNLAICQGIRSANRMINACSLCGQCEVICPNDFPVAEVCRSTRQNMVENNHMPPSAHDFALEDMRFSRSEFCRLSRYQPGMDSSAWLLFPGCQLAGSAPETVERLYDFLCRHLQGGVGLLLDCCGIPAHWAGQAALFTETMDAFRAEVEALGNPTVVTACSSCLSVFREFAPTVKAVSLWEVLADLPLPVPARTPAEPLALHDPCTARHQQPLRDAVRRICADIGLVVDEPELYGELADCCGYGGLMQFANQPLGEQVARVKAERSPLAGLAYCAMCRDNLAATGRPTAHLLDYLFPATDETDPLDRVNPGFSLRHENRARLKARLLKRLWQETPADRPAHAAIRLLVKPEVRSLLERRRILDEDICKVIHHAESTGRYLIDPAHGRRLAMLRPVRTTYWVEYEPEDGGYRIHNSYSHRMVLPEAQS